MRNAEFARRGDWLGSRVDASTAFAYHIGMDAIQFQIELHGGASIALPPEVAAQLPKMGQATVVVMVQPADSEDAAWRMSAYEQFMAGEDESDDAYDAYQ